MGKRFIVPLILVLLLVAVNVQLWRGRGSIPGVAQMQQKIEDQKARNVETQAINDRLASEVRDLKDGLDTVEGKARSELGMVKPNEIFVQIVK